MSQRSILRQGPGETRNWKVQTFKNIYSSKRKRYDGSTPPKEFIKSCVAKVETPARFDKRIKIFTMPCSSLETRANGKFSPFIFKEEENKVTLYKEEPSLRIQIVETLYRLFFEITLKNIIK